MNNCWFMDWVEIDGLRFFYSPQLHSIMKMDIKEERIELERQLLDAEYALPGKFISMQYVDHKLFFLPLYGRSVCIYDLEEKNVEYIQLDANTKLGYTIFSSACTKNKIIGIPGRYSRFIIIDGINKTKKEIEFDIERINVAEIDRSLYFTRSNYIYENVLYVGALMNNYIISISLDTYKVTYYALECCDKEKKGIYTLCGSGQEIYVLGNDGKLRIYELSKGDLSLNKVIGISGLSLDSGVYANSLYINERFVMFSNEGIIECDTFSGKVLKHSFNIKNKVDSIVNSIGYFYAKKLDNIIVAMSANDFVEYLIDKDLKVVGEKKYIVADSELCKLRPYSLAVEQNESYTRNLNFLINYI